MKGMATIAALGVATVLAWATSQGQTREPGSDRGRPGPPPEKEPLVGPWERLSLVEELPPEAERQYEELLKEFQTLAKTSREQIEESRKEIRQLLQELAQAAEEQRAGIQSQLEAQLKAQHEIELNLAERRLQVARAGYDLALRRYIEAEVNLREVKRKIRLLPHVLRRQFHRGPRRGDGGAPPPPEGEMEGPSSEGRSGLPVGRLRAEMPLRSPSRCLFLQPWLRVLDRMLFAAGHHPPGELPRHRPFSPPPI